MPPSSPCSLCMDERRSGAAVRRPRQRCWSASSHTSAGTRPRGGEAAASHALHVMHDSAFRRCVRLGLLLAPRADSQSCERSGQLTYARLMVYAGSGLAEPASGRDPRPNEHWNGRHRAAQLSRPNSGSSAQLGEWVRRHGRIRAPFTSSHGGSGVNSVVWVALNWRPQEGN